MGSTVTCGKAVGAVRHGEEVFYALFEKTYEKNCYPHTPRWSCVGYGRYEQVLQRIFRHAAAAEGGMLQGRSGWIKPEGYIRGWLKELQAPRELLDGEVSMKWGVNSWSRVDIRHAPVLIDHLLKAGHVELVRQIETQDRLELSLHRDVKVVHTLVSGPFEVSPWILLDQSFLSEEIDASLAPRRKNGPGFDLPPPMLKLADTQIDQFVLVKGTSGWRSSDAYTLLQTAICDLAFEAELQSSGAGLKLIAVWRECVSDLPEVQPDAYCTLNPNVSYVDSWKQGQIVNSLKRAGLVEEEVATKEVREIRITAKQMRTNNELYFAIKYADERQISAWKLPDAEQEEAKIVQPAMQLDLCI